MAWDYCTHLAAILRKAQGVIDPESKHEIDVGDECLALRRICDAMRDTIARQRAFIEKAGHLAGCGVTRCDECGLSEKAKGIPLPKDCPEHGYHDFQPGTCTCGHDEALGAG